MAQHARPGDGSPADRMAAWFGKSQDFRDGFNEGYEQASAGAATVPAQADDTLREALAQIESLAEMQAIACQAAHRVDHARNWLDVLIIIERARGVVPSEDPAQDEPTSPEES